MFDLQVNPQLPDKGEIIKMWLDEAMEDFYSCFQVQLSLDLPGPDLPGPDLPCPLI